MKNVLPDGLQCSSSRKTRVLGTEGDFTAVVSESMLTPYETHEEWVAPVVAVSRSNSNSRKEAANDSPEIVRSIRAADIGAESRSN